MRPTSGHAVLQNAYTALSGHGRPGTDSRSFGKRDRLEEFMCVYDSTGVVRDIDVESGMHHLVGVVRRRIPDYGNVVAELGGKAHRRFNTGMCNESNHNEP